MNPSLKIVVIRRDRLGDLLMTLPSLIYLRENFSDAKIDFNCLKEFHDLLSPFCLKWNINLIDRTVERYDAALFLQGKWRDSWELFLTRTPLRVGNYSKFFSFFLLNAGLRQKRSSNGLNEAESNLELTHILIQRLGGKNKGLQFPLELPVSESSKFEAQKKWEQLKLNEQENVVIFHPGMRGSALNVPVNSYLELMGKFESKGFFPVLSVGPESRDVELKEQILQKYPNLKVVSGLKLSELAAFFSMAKSVVAPSTGPLHLAHWVGVETVALFSPIKSQHPKRWAPWGGKKRAQVLIPTVDCPAENRCLEQKCQYFNCMATQDWKSLLLLGESV